MLKMKNEIGSEFWDVPISAESNKMFLDDTAWFGSGRSALTAIIRDIKKHKAVRKAAIPSWCCESMIIPFLQENLDVSFYPVYYDKGLVQDISSVNDADILLVMDYFGYTGYSKINNFDGTVIRDVTHSIFSHEYNDADYCFGSLRKWAGFWTGGFARGIKQFDTKDADKNYAVLRKAAMELKRAYISGNSDSKHYLETFEKAEELLEKSDAFGAEKRDIELAQKLDIGYLKDRRRQNAQVLLNSFSQMAIFPTLSDNDCPMFVPILVQDGKRNELRKFLIDREIYCPIHWPISDYHSLNKETKRIYDGELSLVCDQRYTKDDMNRMVEAIKEFLEG